MEELLIYENRDKLYQFLIDDFGLVKVDEQYDPEAFGNFYVTLSAKYFFLSYVNDRSFLTIDIASKLEPEQSFSLSFVKDLLYNLDNFNSDENTDNASRIKELNNFLKNDFFKVSQLFSPQQYFSTKKQIDELLKIQFIKKNPGLI